MLPEASRLKAGQIDLAGQISLAGQIGLAFLWQESRFAKKRALYAFRLKLRLGYYRLDSTANITYLLLDPHAQHLPC
jgi:hypothetical protein